MMEYKTVEVARPQTSSKGEFEELVRSQLEHLFAQGWQLVSEIRDTGNGTRYAVRLKRLGVSNRDNACLY